MPASGPGHTLAVLLVKCTEEGREESVSSPYATSGGGGGGGGAGGDSGSHASKRRRAAPAMHEETLGMLPLPSDWAQLSSPSLAELRARIADCLQARGLYLTSWQAVCAAAAEEPDASFLSTATGLLRHTAARIVPVPHVAAARAAVVAWPTQEPAHVVSAWQLKYAWDDSGAQVPILSDAALQVRRPAGPFAVPRAPPNRPAQPPAFVRPKPAPRPSAPCPPADVQALLSSWQQQLLASQGSGAGAPPCFKLYIHEPPQQQQQQQLHAPGHAAAAQQRASSPLNHTAPARAGSHAAAPPPLQYSGALPQGSAVHAQQQQHASGLHSAPPLQQQQQVHGGGQHHQHVHANAAAAAGWLAAKEGADPVGMHAPGTPAPGTGEGARGKSMLPVP